MDAAARAELEVLRRRAFGPDADIHDDPAALARLIELEDLARPAVPSAPAETAPTASESPEVAAPAATPLEASPRLGVRPRLKAVRGTILTGTAAAVLIVTALLLTRPAEVPIPAAAPSPAADGTQYVFTADPHSKTLTTI